VLVVEDHEVIRRLCRRVLEGEGHRVQEASSVVHALRLAGEMDELDLLLADVRLGGENSLELVRVLREERPGVRVLLMSGYASPEGGDAAFLEKPFTPAALVSAVRQVLWES
jgi:two-component system cell cycle sensor histidine kinase/response regulator CckA